MRRLATEALRAGAVGFSTSRTLNHRTATGDPTPSLRAGADELEAIALGVADAGPRRGRADLGLLARPRRRVRHDPAPGRAAPGARCRSRWPRATSGPRRGATCWPRSSRRRPRGCRSGPRWRRGPSGCCSGCSPPSTPSRAARSSARSPASRSRPRCARCATRPSGPGSSRTNAAGGRAGGRFVDSGRMFPLGDVPDYEPAAETSVQRLAEARGIDPAALTLDLLAENDGRNFLSSPFSNYADGEPRRLRRDARPPRHALRAGRRRRPRGHHLRRQLPDLRALPLGPRPLARPHGRGLGGGALTERDRPRRRAHATGASWPTGMRADLNVIDFDHLRCEVPVMAYDLPAGGKRLLQRARGYRATIVAGEVTYRDGEPTGALPGRLVRGGAHAARRASRARGDDMDTSELHELEPAAEWRAADVADPEAWTLRLDETDQAELDAALATAKAKSTDPLELERDDFPLDGLAAKLDGVVDVLLDGRGFARIATLDTERYGDDDLTLLYWGIGLHLGEPWAQNKHGHVLGDVTDQGKTIDDPTVRGNELGGIALDYHTDGSDLVGLLCLRTARTGGLSCVANAVAIHNQLVRECPDLAAALYEPLPYDTRGEQAEGAQAFYSRARLHRARRAALRPLHPPVHPRLAAPPRCAPAQRDGPRGHRRGLRAGQRPRLQRVHGPAAGRDAVHQQLPRAPRPHRLRGRRGPRLQAAPQAAVAGHATR